MIFQAYIDDSSQDDELFVLAGHIADAQTWAAFSAEWEQYLDLAKTGKNNIKRFKASEFSSDIWTTRSFYNIIDRYDICSICCCLNKSDLKDAQRGIFIPSSYNIATNYTVEWGILNNIYLILFRMIIEGFDKFREYYSPNIPANSPVDFIFDDQRERNTIWTTWDFYRRRRDISNLFGSRPLFESDEKFLPLQAADLWAYWNREKIKRDQKGKEIKESLRNNFIDDISKPKRKSVVFNMNRKQIAASLLSFARKKFELASSYDVSYSFP